MKANDTLTYKFELTANSFLKTGFILGNHIRNNICWTGTLDSQIDRGTR